MYLSPTTDQVFRLGKNRFVAVAMGFDLVLPDQQRHVILRTDIGVCKTHWIWEMFGIFSQNAQI